MVLSCRAPGARTHKLYICVFFGASAKFDLHFSRGCEEWEWSRSIQRSFAGLSNASLSTRHPTICISTT